MENFSDKLKRLRKEQNLSQEDVAFFTGVARSTIAHYELGKRAPDFDAVVKLSQFFKVPLDYFATSGEDQDDTTLSPQTTRLMNTVRSMDEDQISLVADMAEVVKKYEVNKC